MFVFRVEQSRFLCGENPGVWKKKRIYTKYAKKRGTPAKNRDKGNFPPLDFLRTPKKLTNPCKVGLLNLAENVYWCLFQ